MKRLILVFAFSLALFVPMASPAQANHLCPEGSYEIHVVTWPEQRSACFMVQEDNRQPCPANWVGHSVSAGVYTYRVCVLRYLES